MSSGVKKLWEEIYRAAREATVDSIEHTIERVTNILLEGGLELFERFSMSIENVFNWAPKKDVILNTLLGFVIREYFLADSWELNEKYNIINIVSTSFTRFTNTVSYWFVRLLLKGSKWKMMSNYHLKLLAPALYYFYLSMRDKPVSLPEGLVLSLVSGLDRYVMWGFARIAKDFYSGLFIEKIRMRTILSLISEYNNLEFRGTQGGLARTALSYALTLKAIHGGELDVVLKPPQENTSAVFYDVLTRTLSLLAPIDNPISNRLLSELYDLYGSNSPLYSVSMSVRVLRISNIWGRNPPFYKRYRDVLGELLGVNPDLERVVQILVDRIVTYESEEALDELKVFLGIDIGIPIKVILEVIEDRIGRLRF